MTRIGSSYLHNPPKPNSNGKSANEPGVKAADKSAKGPKQEAVPVRMPDKASQSAPAAEAVPKPSKADVLNPSVKTADPVAPQGIPAFRHTLPKTPHPHRHLPTATNQSSSRELPAGPAATRPHLLLLLHLRHLPGNRILCHPFMLPNLPDFLIESRKAPSWRKLYAGHRSL